MAWILFENTVLYLSKVKKSSASIKNEDDNVIFEQDERCLQLSDVRIPLIFMVLFNVAFFGTGNFASIASFEISSVYRFITVFSPFLTTALLIFKLLIPFMLVICAFSAITKLHRLPRLGCYFLVILLSDVMTIHFFLDTGGLTTTEWNKIWRLKLQHRLKFLLWKVAAQVLPIAKSATSSFKICLLCEGAGETYEHLFLACPVSTHLWILEPWPMRTTCFIDQPITSWIKFLLNPSNMLSDVQDEWQKMILAVTLTLDTIWYARNKLVHDGHKFDLQDLAPQIRRRYHAHNIAWTQKINATLLSWVPPPESGLKINFDASVHDNWLCMAAVCRNWNGEIQQARISKVPGNDPFKGEARAAQLACSLAKDFQGQKIWLEGDAQLLINQIMDLSSPPDWSVETEIMSIRELMRLNPLWSFHWTLREGNSMAHHLARWGQVHKDKDQLGPADIPKEVACCDNSAVYRSDAYFG